MRPVCTACVKKHIGKAIILLCEAANGYPLHKWLALANLSEAEDECVGKYIKLAHKIREVRIAIETDKYEGNLLDLIQDVILLELEQDE